MRRVVPAVLLAALALANADENAKGGRELVIVYTGDANGGVEDCG